MHRRSFVAAIAAAVASTRAALAPVAADSPAPPHDRPAPEPARAAAGYFVAYDQHDRRVYIPLSTAPW